MNKRPKIWVTQTRPRALDSAKGFESLGLKAQVSPVLNIEVTSDDVPPPSLDTMLIFTARNGVRAFSHIHKSRRYEVVCVGDATASLARSCGFDHVTSVGGTSQDVINWVKQTVALTRPLRHCSGRHVRGDIVEALKDVGYRAERIEYYASSPIETLDIDIADLEYVAVYSPLGAKTVAQLLRDKDTSRLRFLCISEACHEGLGRLASQAPLIATAPNQTAMLNRLKLDLADRTGQI